MTSKKSSSQEKEPTVSDGVQILLAIADQLVRKGLARWNKLDIDGTEGFALFFPARYWKLVGEKLILRGKPK